MTLHFNWHHITYVVAFCIGWQLAAWNKRRRDRRGA